jgi:membrane-bound ClpP family serine protease
VVSKKIDPEGKVFVHGELWRATAKVSLNEGEKARVVGVQDLVVEVEPLSGQENRPPVIEVINDKEK